jgi:hypothetical protein
MDFNLVQVIKEQPVTFDGDFVWLLFGAVVLGNIGEHFSKKGE